MVLERKIKKRKKLWKKLGFEYDEILMIFKRINFLEGFVNGLGERFDELNKFVSANEVDISQMKNTITSLQMSIDDYKKSISRMEKFLAEAVKICNQETEKLKEESKKRKNLYDFLTKQEVVED